MQGIAGRIRVGFVGAMLYRGMMESVKAFQSRAPEIDVTLYEMNTDEQIRALGHDRIDVGLIHSGHLAPSIGRLQLLSEPFLCCLPVKHPFAKREVIDLRQLGTENFVMFPRALSSHYYDRIVALCINAGFSPRIRHEVRQWLTIVRMVEEGMGIALVPAAMRNTGIKKVVFLPLRNSKIKSETLCIWREKEKTPAIERFIACLTPPRSPLGAG